MSAGTAPPQTIGVAGAGTMGAGIAQIAALGGYETYVCEVDEAALGRGIEMLRDGLRSGRSVLATASGPNGPLAAGSYQLAHGVAEITGVGVLPASRRRGLGGAVTHALAFDALRRGARTIFLSATDPTVARIYARLGFREIGTAMIAEPPDG